MSTGILVAFITAHAVLALADGEPRWGLTFEILGFLAVLASFPVRPSGSTPFAH